jgi:hypothetical protein
MWNGWGAYIQIDALARKNRLLTGRNYKNIKRTWIVFGEKLLSLAASLQVALE